MHKVVKLAWQQDKQFSVCPDLPGEGKQEWNGGWGLDSEKRAAVRCHTQDFRSYSLLTMDSRLSFLQWDRSFLWFVLRKHSGNVQSWMRSIERGGRWVKRLPQLTLGTWWGPNCVSREQEGLGWRDFYEVQWLALGNEDLFYFSFWLGYGCMVMLLSVKWIQEESM